MIISEDEKEFYTKVSEQIKQVLKNGKVVLTKFLSLRESEITKELARLSRVFVYFNGGIENSERVKCLISQTELTITDSIFNISCYKIEYNKRYLELNHRNVLGTLMSLNLDRALFGDIKFVDKACYFFFSSEIERIILSEFTMINRVPITLQKETHLISAQQKYEVSEIIVSSMRIDGIIAHVYHLARSLSQELFRNNSVYRNGQLVSGTDEKCEENDNISVRKYGRFIVEKVLRTTKSGKIVLEIKKPIN